MTEGPTPRVSIPTATYNRSNVLRIVAGAVRRQTVQDCEWVIVGDACTDDTADVVASFGDPRIRYVNLPESHGEQSGPNNVALSLARGYGRRGAMLNDNRRRRGLPPIDWRARRRAERQRAG